MSTTLVLSPHPDDETLGAGGLIATLQGLGVEPGVLVVTDGEHAYADVQGLGPIREMEQAEALACTSPMETAENENEFVARLAQLVTRNCHITAPWIGDYHPGSRGLWTGGETRGP